jgi:ribosomal protein S3
MGHIVNPIGTHVGISRSWKFKWTVQRKSDYKYFVDVQNFFDNFFTSFFNEPLFKEAGIMYIFHKMTISRGLNSMYITLHDSAYSMFLFEKYKRGFKRLLRYLYKKNKSRITHSVVVERFRIFKKFVAFKLKKIMHPIYFQIFFWICIKKIIITYVSRFLPKFCQLSNLFLIVTASAPRTQVYFSATSVAKYFVRKFEQRHLVRNMVYPVIRFFNRCKAVNGFKLTFSGRFSREERATYEWFKEGTVALNRFTSFVDYDYAFTTLKFGAVCVKVWINYHMGALFMVDSTKVKRFKKRVKIKKVGLIIF